MGVLVRATKGDFAESAKMSSDVRAYKSKLYGSAALTV